MRRAVARDGLLVAIAVVSFGAVAGAQELGHKFLGGLGLNAGSVPPPGVLLLGRYVHYAADDLMDRAGREIPVPGFDLDADAGAGGVSLTLKLPILRAYYTAAFGIPVASIRAGTERPEASLDRFGLADIYVLPFKLGWRLPHIDLTSSYALYVPSGAFQLRGATGGVGRGHFTHEFAGGGTVYFDRARTFTLSALASYELNEPNRPVDITRGDTVQIQGGAGKRLFRIIDVGVAGYGEWQVRDDRGADVPPSLRGARDRVYGVGPELDVRIPMIRSVLSARWEHDIAARSRPEGQVVYVGLAVALWRPAMRGE